MNDKSLLSTQLEGANIMIDELRPAILACEKFTVGLNIKPNAKTVKTRMGIEYIPISAIETNLDRMFTGLWQTKNMEWRLIANEIVVSLELHVFHPVARVWLSRCGVGAAQMRMNSGCQITDINSKKKNALEMDVAHAKADALKNAAKSFGDIFGRNLSRPKNDVTNFTPVVLGVAELDTVKQEIKSACSTKAIIKLWAKNTKFHSNKKVVELYNETLSTLQDLQQ